MLAKFEIGKAKIRIYDDVDCNCGRRRNKRDKSVYVVGYRMHTLAAINPDNGQSISLISVLAPANHHDSNFMLLLINLGKTIGLNLKVITADETYHDENGALLEQTVVRVIAPPNKKIRFRAMSTLKHVRSPAMICVKLEWNMSAAIRKATNFNAGRTRPMHDSADLPAVLANRF